jgi:hypothetical protein
LSDFLENFMHISMDFIISSLFNDADSDYVTSNEWMTVSSDLDWM